tara:strand:+ start:2544 stop:2729 length:186 start_codon:yes stop_codon:yes gene_type:complete
MKRNCNCTDCGGKRVSGPCNNDTYKDKIKCNCTDCGGKRKRGPCYLEETDIIILYPKVSEF